MRQIIDFDCDCGCDCDLDLFIVKVKHDSAGNVYNSNQWKINGYEIHALEKVKIIRSFFVVVVFIFSATVCNVM